MDSRRTDREQEVGSARTIAVERASPAEPMLTRNATDIAPGRPCVGRCARVGPVVRWVLEALAQFCCWAQASSIWMAVATTPENRSRPNKHHHCRIGLNERT